MDRIRLATVWLGGCAGCHMSILDLDEFLIDLAGLADVVYSPVADVKEYPENVDVAIVEGAVANEDNLEMILKVRERTKILISLGDCAVTGNVTAMRNPLGDPEPILQRVYELAATVQGQKPCAEGIVPKLLPQVKPLHEVVPVDAYIPGCPPPAPRIRRALEQLVTTGAVQLTGDDLKPG
jgi:NAD-reducing hydrogenase small subunit